MKLYTSKIVASWLGLTERRVRQLRDQGILEESMPGLYNLRQCVSKYIEYLRTEVGGNLTDERAKLTRAKRESQEMANEVAKKNLHRTEDIQLGLQTVILNVRSRMLSLPAKLAPSISEMGGDRARIFDAIHEAVTEVLEELSTMDINKMLEIEQDGTETEA